jgi:hypothetical protein
MMLVLEDEQAYKTWPISDPFLGLSATAIGLLPTIAWPISDQILGPLATSHLAYQRPAAAISIAFSNT